MLTPTDYSTSDELSGGELASSIGDVNPAPRPAVPAPRLPVPSTAAEDTARLDHLRALEAESIHIIREVVAEFERPVMLYSIGKDSSVLLRLPRAYVF